MRRPLISALLFGLGFSVGFVSQPKPKSRPTAMASETSIRINSPADRKWVELRIVHTHCSAGSPTTPAQAPATDPSKTWLLTVGSIEGEWVTYTLAEK